jgi:stage V sporulation protein AA
MKRPNLYIKVDKNNMIHNKEVFLEDVAKLYSVDKEMVKNLNKQLILTITSDKKANYMVSILKLIEYIEILYPDVDVVNLGQIDFIVHYEPPKKTIKIIEYLKVAFVSLMVFFGATFTIMTFNTDAGVGEVLDNVYESIMGYRKSGGSILELSYSIGLPVGIIIFFNHFSKLKLGTDPTPLQVQMRLYEENLDKTLIENANREGKTIDVD